MIFKEVNVTYQSIDCQEKMPNKIIKKIIKLNRKDISYMKFVFEGYEGVGTITTIDKNEAVVELSIMPDFNADSERILDALRGEIIFQEIEYA